MRLAFCLYKYIPHGGLAKDMLRIAAEATRRGHVVDVLTGEWEGDRPAKTTVTVLDEGGLTNHGRADRFVRRLSSRLGASTYDAVVGFNKMPNLDFYYAADGCFAARARRSRPRAYELTPRYRCWRRLETSVFGPSSGTRIFLLSEQARLEYRAFYATADERLRLLPPTLDRIHRRQALAPKRRAAIRTGLGAGKHDALLLLVGSSFHTKGVDRALRALATLNGNGHRRVRLAVIGRGDIAKYRSLATRLGVADRVEFLGGRDDVPDLLRSADLLIHPARQENTGTVLLEALAAGLPVITTADCGYAHHVRDAKAGTVLKAPFDQHALERGLHELLSGPDHGRLSTNARRYGQNEALYRMPEQAVDLIENWRQDMPRLAFSGYVHPELRDLSRQKARLEDWLRIQGDVFRLTRDRKTLRFEHGGCGYFLKAHFGVGWREIVKNLAQLKLPVLDAGNEWLAIHALKVLGLPTVTAMAWGQGVGWARRQSFIVTRELQGLSSLEEYLEQSKRRDRTEAGRRHRLVQKVAAMARTLHGNGINHRDFYLCHFLFDPASLAKGGDVTLYLIDLHRAQVRHRTPRRWRIKDISGLYYSALDAALSRHERLRFVKAYMGADSLRRALADSSFWSRVERRAQAMREAERRRGYADVSGRPKHLN